MKRLAAGVCALCLLLVSAIVLGGAGTAAEAPSSVIAGHNRRLGSDAPGGRAKDAPGLAVNPADARHVVEVDTDVFNKRCDVHASFDSGMTWRETSLVAPAGYPEPPCDAGQSAANLDGGIVFGASGRVYVAFASTKSGEGRSVLVARSDDGGRTFSPGVVAMPGATGASPPSYGAPKIAVQMVGGGDRVFVAAGRSNGAWVARSDDGGTSWTVPVDAAGGAGTEITQPVVTAAGDVAIGWRSSDSFIVVGRSSDGGATWTKTNAAANAPSAVYPRLVADPNENRVYVAYSPGPPPRPAGSTGSATPEVGRQPNDHFIPPDADVLVARSADGGATWAQPVRVNDDPVGNNVAQRHPNMSVAPDGRLDVVWHDRRHGYRSPRDSHAGNGEARLGDTYYAFSTDGGASFSANHRITDRIINVDIGLDYRCCAYWTFGPVSVPLGAGRILVAWMDSREGSFDTDNQDIYLSTVDLRGSGAAPVRTVAGAGDASASSVSLSQFARPGGPEAVLAPNAFAAAAVTRIVVVNRDDPAAASAASALARSVLGPLLASPAGGLTPELQAEVRRMRAIGAFVVGDSAALAPAIVDQLAAAGIPRDKIVRLSAANAADVGAAVATAMDRRTATEKLPLVGRPAFDGAIIANAASSEVFVASALSAALRLPYLFVERDSIPKPTSDALSSLGIQRTLVLGGTASVSDEVMNKLPSPKRLDGRDAAGVSEAVTAESLLRLLPKNQVFVADPAVPVEGALLGAAAARVGGVLLAAPSGDQATVRAAAARTGVTPFTDRLVALGGSGSAGSSPAAGAPATESRATPESLPATGGAGGWAPAILLLIALGCACLARRAAPSAH